MLWRPRCRRRRSCSARQKLAKRMDRIVVRPLPEGGHELEIIGDLAGLLGFADGERAEAYEASARSLELVAGVGFEPTAFRL